MEIPIKNLEIRQDTASSRFYFTEKNAKDAQLTYKLHDAADPNIVEFTHTYVPEPLRETGLGTKLAETGIRWAIDQGYEIKPTCSFVRDYMESREDYSKLIK